MKSIKTKLDLNNKQRTACLQHAGTGRYTYNWGLALCIDRLHKGERIPTAIDLHKLLNKEVKPKNLWYYNSSKCAPQQALRNLEEAFKRFWIKHQENKNLPFNKKYKKKYICKYNKGELKSLTTEHEKFFPNFKKRGGYDNFYLDGSIKFDLDNRKRIKVPILGWLRTFERLPENISPTSVFINRTAGDWFISFRTSDENQIAPPNGKNKTIGADVGISTLVTLSDGKTYHSNKSYKKRRNRIGRLSRQLCRQRLVKEKAGRKTNSKNYEKTKIKLAKEHQKIASERLDKTHKITTHLAKNHSKVIIEGLNVAGMMKNHHLASAIADGGFYEFKRQLEYKCAWYGSELVVADRWFPSSQLCSCCGHQQKMPLRKRIFICQRCGLVIDRDLNAAINLENYELYIYTQSHWVKACGDAKVQGGEIRPVSIDETGTRQPFINLVNDQICIGS